MQQQANFVFAFERMVDKIKRLYQVFVVTH